MKPFQGLPLGHAAAVVSGLIGALDHTTADATTPPSTTTAEDRRIAKDFARCLVQNYRDEAVKLALSKRKLPGGKYQAQSLRSYRNCTPDYAKRRGTSSQRTLPLDALLFALSDELVRQEFPTFDPNLIRTAQPLPTAGLLDEIWPVDPGKKPSKRVEEARARANSFLAPQMFGECAVRTDPAGAHRLLMTTAGSAAESSALRALQAAFGHCVTQGSQFTASRESLRGIVALSYYRLAHAPRVQPAGAKQ